MKCIRFVSIIIVVLMMSLTCFGSEKLSYNDAGIRDRKTKTNIICL